MTAWSTTDAARRTRGKAQPSRSPRIGDRQQMSTRNIGCHVGVSTGLGEAGCDQTLGAVDRRLGSIGRFDSLPLTVTPSLLESSPTSTSLTVPIH